MIECNFNWFAMHCFAFMVPSTHQSSSSNLEGRCMLNVEFKYKHEHGHGFVMFPTCEDCASDLRSLLPQIPQTDHGCSKPEEISFLQ